MFDFVAAPSAALCFVIGVLVSAYDYDTDNDLRFAETRAFDI